MLKVLKVLQDQLVLLDLKDLPVPKDHKVLKVLKVLQDLLDQRDHKDLKVLKVLQDLLDLKV